MSAAAQAITVEDENKAEEVAPIPKKKRKPRKPKKEKDLTKPKVKRAPSAWILHVAATRALVPGMSYKTALKEASKTYKKVVVTPVTPPVDSEAA